MGMSPFRTGFDRNPDGTPKAITVTGPTAAAKLGVWERAAILVKNNAGNPVTFTLEGSVDSAAVGFATIAYGTGATGAYTQAPVTVPAITTQTLYLPTDDYVKYLRANLSAANSPNGTTFEVVWEVLT